MKIQSMISRLSCFWSASSSALNCIYIGWIVATPGIWPLHKLVYGLGNRSPMADEHSFCLQASITYDSPVAAQKINHALSVDPELHPGQVTRSLHTDGSELIIRFSAAEPKLLRAAVGTFFDLLALATRTMEKFTVKV